MTLLKSLGATMAWRFICFKEISEMEVKGRGNECRRKGRHSAEQRISNMERRVEER